MVFQSGCGRCLAARGETGCCPNNFASSSSSLQPSGNGQPTPAASARSRYSWTVLSPIRQLRAICRCPNLNSNRNRRTSLTFRMDDLLAGTLFSLCMEVSMPRYCTALLRPSSVHVTKTFRSKPNTIPLDEQNCSPSHRNGVRLQNGMLFGFTTEWCSPSDRNRVRLRPDSPIGTIAVQANAKAASKWCEYATVQERQHGGKPWSYLLIPRDAVKNRLSWAVWRTRFKIASPQNFD